jgi:hypothetical protein
MKVDEELEEEEKRMAESQDNNVLAKAVVVAGAAGIASFSNGFVGGNQRLLGYYAIADVGHGVPQWSWL